MWSLITALFIAVAILAVVGGIVVALMAIHVFLMSLGVM